MGVRTSSKQCCVGKDFFILFALLTGILTLIIGSCLDFFLSIQLVLSSIHFDFNDGSVHLNADGM